MWDNYMGIDYCIRALPVKRVTDKRGGFSIEDDEALASARKSLVELDKKSVPGTVTGRNARTEQRELIIADIARLEDDRKELTAWENKQIRRCNDGHLTLTGLHYFYFHFCWIQEVSSEDGSSGAITNIRPKYRSCDDWAFRLLMEVQAERSGTVMVKRRRFGWTWIEVAFALFNLLLRGANVFFITKDEDDQRKFFDRLKFMHDMLPPYLQKEKVNDALERKVFAPSPRIAGALGLDISKIPNAVLRCSSPQNISAAAGETSSIVLIDEAGELPNLLDVLGIAMPMLAASNGLDRAGCLIAGGTVGNMEVSGHVLRRMYNNPGPFEVRPVFVPGWMGTYFDELGNDDKERAIKKIQDRVTRWEEAGMPDRAIEERQKYPLTISDAFMRSTEGKPWPADKIGEAERLLIENPPVIKYGLFFRDKEGNVRFRQQEPNKSGDTAYPEHIGYGQVQILEEPLEEARVWRAPYVMGTDPVDLDLTKEHGKPMSYKPSDFAFVVMKRYENVGGDTDWPVCVYYGRPEDLEDAYEQCLLASIYYHDASNNIERQKGTRLYKYIGDHGDPQRHIAWGSGISQQLETDTKNWGFHASTRWSAHMVRRGRAWWKKNYHVPLIKRFIDESLDFLERNTDVMSAFLAALQWSEECDAREDAGESKLRSPSREVAPKSLWQKNMQGTWVPTQAPGRKIQEFLSARRNGHNRSSIAGNT